MGKFYGWVNFMVNKLYLTKDVVKKEMYNILLSLKKWRYCPLCGLYKL